MEKMPLNPNKLLVLLIPLLLLGLASVGYAEEANNETTYLTDHSIELYTPSDNTKILEYTDIYVELQVLKGNFPVEGQVKAHIDEHSTEMELTRVKTYSGYINTGSSGNKTLKVTYESEEGYLEKEISLRVSGDAEDVYGPSLNIINPREGAEVGKNSTVLLEAELLDARGYIIHGEEIDYTIKRYEEKLEEGRIQQRGYIYSKSYNFPEPGEYTIQLNWKQIQREVTITVGPEHIPPEDRLNVHIVTPQPTSYSTTSELLAAIIVSRREKLIDNATITAILNGEEEIPMEPTGAGGYGGVIGEVPGGNHLLLVTVEYEEETAAASVEFQATSNYLEVAIKDPSEDELNISQGQAIYVKANVTDQNNMIASNAVVTLEVFSDSGEAIMRMRQDKETGIYHTEYYPKETDTYQIRVNAYKSNHVGHQASTEVKINVETIETRIEEIIRDLSIETLLKVALIIAIVILLLALITRLL